MATKEKSKNKQIGDQIKRLLSRNQRWLADEIHMREPLLSEKINDRKDFTQEDLDKINKALGTSFKL
jgi:plasmid maintenance system antidote protein VapI